ncbi:MAG: hypothetical protein ACO2PN_23120 [Pyrobaculum sp.]
MDTAAQWRIRLPQRPLDSPEVGSERWSYDDAEEYIYGKLAEVVYNGAMKGGVALVERLPRDDIPITMSKAKCASVRWGGWTRSRRRKSMTRCRWGICVKTRDSDAGKGEVLRGPFSPHRQRVSVALGF